MESVADPRVENLVTAYFRHITSRDKTRWLELFDSKAVLHEPVGTTPAECSEGHEQVWHLFTSPFAKLSMRADEIFYAGAGAAVRWSALATSEAGATVEFAGISVFEMQSEGRIQTVMSYWDPAEVLIRLAGD